MNLYRCFVRGENFPLELDGQSSLFGFYTTRFVHADTPKQAELAALEMLRNDPTLDVEPSKRTRDTMVYFESISEIDSIPTDISEPGTGYAFFRMEA